LNIIKMSFLISISIFFFVINFCKSQDYDVALFDEISKQNLKRLKKLITDENKNTPGPGGQTPLMHAVLTGKKNVVKWLLEEKNVDTSIGEKDGYTPMHGAGFQGRAEIATMLIRAGLDPNDVHKDGFTPMHRACWGREQRHLDTVLVFINEGNVDVEQKAKNGQSCFDFAKANAPMLRALENIRATKQKANNDNNNNNNKEEL